VGNCLVPGGGVKLSTVSRREEKKQQKLLLISRGERDEKKNKLSCPWFKKKKGQGPIRGAMVPETGK